MTGYPPFAEAKTIRDIGSFMPVAFGGEPYERDEPRRAVSRWNDLRETPLPTSVQNGEFFKSRLLDSDVLGIRYDAGTLKLTLQSDDAETFASALQDVVSLARIRRVWPIDLTMHEVSFMRAVGFDAQG